MNFNSLGKVFSIVAGLLCSGIAYGQEKAPAKGDELLIAAQKICPVSGEELGSMGAPLKAKSGDQTIFLCCKGCAGKQISKENWAKVMANLAAAQGRCPVMNRALPKNAASVVVNGRKVFVCCPPCTGKIEANPERYLSVVDALLAKNVGQPRDE